MPRSHSYDLYIGLAGLAFATVIAVLPIINYWRHRGASPESDE